MPIEKANGIFTQFTRTSEEQDIVDLKEKVKKLEEEIAEIKIKDNSEKTESKV